MAGELKNLALMDTSKIGEQRIAQYYSGSSKKRAHPEEKSQVTSNPTTIITELPICVNGRCKI
jgi:hypothetical protein